MSKKEKAPTKATSLRLSPELAAELAAVLTHLLPGDEAPALDLQRLENRA